MSAELIKKELLYWLSLTKAKVVCLKGGWGIGKTYTWRKLLEENYKGIKSRSYSYVSLFGLNSVEQIKNAIFENSDGLGDNDSELGLEVFQSKYKRIINRFSRKIPGFFKSIPVINSYIDTNALQSLFFLSIKDYIICIDDIERKGVNLLIKDIFGLVSYLKEERNCHIILILNEDVLEKKDKEDYDIYNEKVIDISIKFSRNSSESIDIALQGGQSKVRSWIAENCLLLDISNIRVIQKIEWIVSRIEPFLIKYDDAVLQKIVHSLVLLAWCRYSNLSLLDFLRNKRGKYFYSSDNKKKTSDEESAWNKLLDNYEFIAMDEFDLVLLQGIEKGFFDENINKYADQLSDRLKAANSSDSFESVWQLYHDSFQENQQEIVDKMYVSFKKNVRYIAPINLDGTVKLFKDFGELEKSHDIIAYYVEHVQREREFFDIKNTPFGGDITDEDVIKAFNEKYLSFQDNRSPVEVLLKISKNKSWSRDDIALLSKLNSDDFYQIFKNNSGRELSKIIRTSLQFSQVQDDSEKNITSKARDALKKIGRESQINRRRVSKYGIEV